MTISMTAGTKAAAAKQCGRGLRLTTPETLEISNQAQDFRLNGTRRVTRIAAWREAKRAAAAMGFGTAKLVLLDLLFSLSKAHDWTDPDGLGPVVWPSNAWLAARMNLTQGTVRKHLRALWRAGLITYEDSPTCRRHGKRDDNGRITQAFGIDLSPLAMRHDELKAFAAAVEAEAREITRLRDCATVVRKRIRSLIADALKREDERPHESAGQDAQDTARREQWHHGLARLDVIRERQAKDIETVEKQLADLEALCNVLEDLYSKAFGGSEASSYLVKNDHRGGRWCPPNTYTASEYDSVICSKSGIALTSDTQSNEAACGRMAFEEKPRANPEDIKQAPVETETPKDLCEEQSTVDHATQTDAPADPDDASVTPDETRPIRIEPHKLTGTHSARAERHDGASYKPDVTPAGTHGDDVLQLSIGLLRTACPAIETLAPGALQHWQMLRDSGHVLCAGADINRQVFDEASDALGPDIAIAATAVTIQKAAQGDVFNPGAYLRTLTKRGRAGNLHIARSLHALADRNTSKKKADTMDDTSTNHTASQQNHHEGHQDDARSPDKQDRNAKDAALHHQTYRPMSAHADNKPRQPSPPFPGSGSIAYSPWADIVRANTHEPIPDVDRVADAFRGFCKRNAIDMTSPNITTIFTTFSAKWSEPQ